MFYIPKAIKVSILPIVLFTFVFCFSLLNTVSKVSAACSPPATSYGTDTLSVNVPSSTTYTVWVQMQTSTSTNNSVQLSIGSSCFNVGGSTLPTNQLTWVNYQNGSTSQVMQVALTTGSNTLVFTGTQQGVGIGSVLLLANPQCIPTGDGSNCTTNQPSPTQPGSLSYTINSPTSVKLNWTASSETQGPGVGGYYIYRNTSSGTPLGTVPVGTLTYTDNTASAGSSYTYYVKAYDVGNPPNTSTAASVNVQMPANPPTAPVLSGTATNAVSANLSWPQVSDTGGPGLSSYKIYQGDPISGGTQIGTVTYNSSTSTYNYPINGLNENSTYSYYVVAFDVNGTSSQPSNVVTITTPNYPNPNPPTASTITPVITPTSITFNWVAGSDPSPGPGVAGYTIYRDGNVYQGIANPSTTSFQDTGLSQNTTYNYCVSEYDSAIPADGSTNYCLPPLTTTSYPTPSTPSGLTSNSITQTTVNLTWNASTDTGGPGIGGYWVERTDMYTGSVNDIQVTTTSFHDISLVPGHLYKYTVQAFDTVGDRSALSSPTSFTTTSYPGPNQVTGLSYSNVTTNSATINWTPATQISGGLPVAGYYIIVNGSTEDQVSGASTNTYSLTSLSPSTTYTINIQTYDTANEVNKLNVPSVNFVTQQIPDIQPPTAPSNLVATAYSASQINLSWSASTSLGGTVAGYNIYRSNDSSCSTLVGTSNTTSYGDTNLSYNVRYYYCVQAYTAAGLVSAKSSFSSAITYSIQPNTAWITGYVSDLNTKTPLIGAAVVTGTQATVYGSETALTYNFHSKAKYQLSNVLVDSTNQHTLKYTYPNYKSGVINILTSQPIVYSGVNESLTHL